MARSRTAREVPATRALRPLAARFALAATLPALALSPPAAAQMIGPGISLELARHRAATLSDLRYDLSFHVPRDRSAPIIGVATLTFQRAGDGPVVLDFADPGAIRAVTVAGRPVEYRAEHGHVVVPAAVLAPGRAALTVTFTPGDGPLNRRDEFLYTLFVPARAHEAFPSFDQPDLKARFRLTLAVPGEWTAVANGEVVERREAGDIVVYRFAETEPLPTYLFSFVAGRFQVEEAVRDGRPMRMYHRETEVEKVARNREAIFDLHAAALRWLEEYTGIPYPFGKFDFVLVPAFQYNGMEHPGAILYRESSLLLDESATRNQELGRASVIAHETAHMWFGDLVTMRWFDDVWMKEVFANFMAAKIVDPSFPELDHALRFLLAHYPSAYSVDRTAGANPIRQSLENLNEAGALYGAIIYQKAPIVMRQLERLTGEASFREATRRYLAAHASGNASWPELVAILDEVTPVDVASWSRVWVEEPGRPTLALEPRAAAESRPGAMRPPVDDPGPGDVTAALVQSDPRGRGLVWPQQVTVRTIHTPRAPSGGDGGAAGGVAPGAAPGEVVVRDVPVRIDAVRSPVSLPTVPGARLAAVIPNGHGLGYGLFLLDDATRDHLLETLPGLPGNLTRAVGWIGLWEMMLEGRVSPEAMLDLGLRTVGTDQDELFVQQVLGDLSALYWRFLDPSARARWSPRLEPGLWERMLRVEGASLRAAYFNAWRSIATSPGAVHRMAAVWRGEEEIPGLPLSERDRTTLALNLAVREAPAWESVLDAQRAAIDNPDRRERFDFIRPAVSADPAVRDAFFASLAEPRNRTREEWVVASLAYLHHPLRADASVRYIRPSLELLREIRDTGDIFFPTRWLAGTLGSHASPEAAAIVRRFIDDHPDFPPRLMEKLLQEADPVFRASR